MEDRSANISRRNFVRGASYAALVGLGGAIGAAANILNHQPTLTALDRKHMVVNTVRTTYRETGTVPYSRLSLLTIVPRRGEEPAEFNMATVNYVGEMLELLEPEKLPNKMVLSRVRCK